MESQRDPLSTVPNAEVRLPAQAIVAAIDRLTAATERQAKATEELVTIFGGIVELARLQEDPDGGIS